MAERDRFRERYTPEQRAAPLRPYIDPGFVNHRLVETFVGPEGVGAIDSAINDIPPSMPAFQKDVRVDHIYTQVALAVCDHLKVSSLGDLACSPTPTRGQIVCSTDVLEGTESVYHEERASVRWVPDFEAPREVSFEFSTRHISSDTCRMQLSKRSTHSFIGRLVELEGTRLVFEPLIIGGPWLNPPPQGVNFDTMWLHYAFFEHFVEDIDEFREVQKVPHELDWSAMKHIRESAFKTCICEILGDQAKADWGGERSDHFSSHLHVQGRRMTAAFVFKGPGAGFAEMEPRHLGKNGDQIFRLASEPAELLIVQHCHNIGPAVRATLRAFAVQPSRARRYCIIDGRDSFRLLSAYGLVQRALTPARRSG